MKNKTRILWGLLALFLAVSLILPAEAASPPTVSISSGTVKAGESVTLTVSIKDNPGLATCMLYLYYDTNVFSADPDRDVKAEIPFLLNGSIITNSIEEAKSVGRYEGHAGKNGLIVLWYNGSGKQTTDNGNMFSVTLHTKNNAQSGTYSVELDYFDENTSNEKGEVVRLNLYSGTVTVAGGAENSASPSQPPEMPTFTDVSGHWAYDYIEDSAQLGYMEGYQNLFRPDDGMTRCEFVTALWRAMGKPKAKKPSTFTDLNQSWYLEAVAWAQENNIIQGTGGTEFEPYWPVSREQVAIILHRLSGSPSGMEVMLSGTYDALFTDSGRIHSWAKPGVYWAVYQEIYCGVTSPNVGNALHATDNATRAQIAVMLVRFHYGQGGE